MKAFPLTLRRYNSVPNGFFLFIYSCSLFLICLFAYRKPLYNWDMLAYMAIVLKVDHPEWNAAQVHEATYNISMKKVPSSEYGYLIQGPYRERMSKEVAEFDSQLPFYSIKPLYIAVILLFYKAGLSLPMATVLPSILSYFFIGLLLFYWMRKYFKPLHALIVSLLIMYAPFIIEVARMSTPDALSSFCLLAAFCFILEKPSLHWMLLFFLLAVFTRLDNIITCFIILSSLYVFRKSEDVISFRQYILMSGVLIAGYFSITLITALPFGWNILYYPAMIHYFNLSYTFHSLFSLKAYLELFYSHAITAIVFYHFTLFTFFAVVTVIPFLKIPFAGSRLNQWFPILLILIILIRFFLYPNMDDRFYVSFYLCILILLVEKFSSMVSMLNRKKISPPLPEQAAEI